MVVHPARWSARFVMLAVCLSAFCFVPFVEPPRAEGADRKALIALEKKRIRGADDVQVHPFFGDFTGDRQEDALTVSYYHPKGGGNSYSIEVSLYRGAGNGFRFIKTVPDVYGQSPRAAKFSRGQVRITLTTLGPNDARCCPSVPKEYVVAAP
ncbi:hypothetical protein ABZT49_24650 [Methylobacterium sp. EM32]|uniref:hypothetical protein n=1 Tax=Methylobacterium sp. EM32 TaxID=3163481 RepID=UPI0033BB494D